MTLAISLKYGAGSVNDIMHTGVVVTFEQALLFFVLSSSIPQLLSLSFPSPRSYVRVSVHIVILCSLSAYQYVYNSKILYEGRNYLMRMRI